MTVRDLQSKLMDLGVRSDSYCLLDDSNEAYCLQRSRTGWYVYYAERGLQNGRTNFDSESEACEYLLDLLRNDPNVRG